MRILLVEDDLPLAQALQQSLRYEGFVVNHVENGKDALAALAIPEHDMAILDLGLPDMDGLQVLKKLRAKKQSTPVIILTARDTIEQRVQGLDFGADDYLAKPFQTRELLARIKAILRRIDIILEEKETSPVVKVNHVSLNHSTREVTCHNQNVEFTGTEYQLLNMLMQKAGEIVTKEQLSEQVLGRKLSAFDRSIDMHISNIRRKLLPLSPTDKFKTIRGSGYIFLTGDLS